MRARKRKRLSVLSVAVWVRVRDLYRGPRRQPTATADADGHACIGRLYVATAFRPVRAARLRIPGYFLRFTSKTSAAGHRTVPYISSPSQLTYPIPPHLLSKPLLQRHHFLHLTPEQPDEYLCWPSSPERKARVIDLLESRYRPIDDDQPAIYPVQYSFDGEDFFAHVDISFNTGEGPRIILQWDDESREWKYHNTDLMPFPLGSRAVLEDVLVPPPPPNPVSVQPVFPPSYLRSFDANDLRDDSDDDDDYWNAYGVTDGGDGLYGHSAPASTKDAASSEDAYWAQYASVQGSADSTMPSPVSQTRRKPLPSAQQLEHDKEMDSPVPLPVPVRLPSEDTYAEPLPIPPSIIPRPRRSSRWDPASPTALAHLLTTISPRGSPIPSPAPYDSIDAEDSSSPTVGGSDDSELSSSPVLGLRGTTIVAMTAPAENDDTSPQNSPPLFAEDRDEGQAEAIANGAVLSGDEDEDEADLRVALEGLWKMWKRSRESATDPSSFGYKGAREVFLRTAQLVVDRV